MIADLKPYPTYKDSGVGWLGEVPEGWEVRRLGSLVDLRVSNVDKHVHPDELPIRLCNYVDVYKNDRITASMDFSSGSAEPREIERFRLRRGDVLITKDSESWDDIASPALVEYEAPDLVCGYHLAMLRPMSDLRGSFLFRALMSSPVAARFHVAANGVTRFGLTHGGIKAAVVPVPPLSHQLAIGIWLDQVDRLIRRYVAAKRRLIELVEEEKQAVIHRAVTRGLDPNVRLKPSGVDWLGDVPENWEVRRLHELTEPSRPIMYGIVLPGPHVDDGIPIVKGGNCEPGRLTASLLSKTSQEIEEKHARSRLMEGDIAIAIRGGIGAASPVPSELSGANLTQDAARISMLPGVSGEWLLQVLRSQITQEHLKARVRGATVKGINIRDLKRVPIAVPPSDEQEEIAQFIRLNVSRLDLTATASRRQIDLLDELRTRLIADVVTGKLDVRAAAKLADDPAAGPAAADRLRESVSA